MVLAVMGLAAGFFVVNINKAIEGVTRQSPSDVLHHSFRKARLMAVTEKKKLCLYYNPESSQFELKPKGEASATPIAVFPLDESDRIIMENVKFWPLQPREASAQRRSNDRLERMNQVLDCVEFDPTGVSSFVAVELYYKPSVAEPVMMLMDPFSNSELEGEVK